MIKPCAEELFGYGQTKIGIVGTATFSVRYGAKTFPALKFQVTHQGADLLGFDLFCALGFSIKDNMDSVILTVNNRWLPAWAASLPSTISCSSI